MRIFLLLILSILFLSSCSKYQCLSISSGNTQRNERNEFVAENDSLRIIYSFYNVYGTVQLSILNKSSHGILVDWARSSVIAGEQAFSFFDPQIRLQGELDKTNASYAVILNATASQPQSSVFIPPGATISRSGLSLTRGKFIADNNLKFKKEDVRVSGFIKKIKKAPIEKADSPLQFRVYLTFVPEGIDNSAAFVVDRSFYVSQIIRTKAEATKIFPRSLNNNMIIMQKSTGAGTLLIATGSIGLIVLLAVVAGG